MRASTKFLIGVLLLAAVTAPAAYAKTAAELLREGLYVEEVEGDLDKAIGIYQQIIEDAAAPKNLVAQALYRQGSIYLKKKQEQEARALFTKLVEDYGDQTEVVEKVKPLLDELGNADPASLMPPETIAYIEIGSPGRQVETIFSMLKGTPVEEALASLSQGGGGQGGPAAIIQKVLTPATLGELKKIRGIGIGITDLTQDNPPAVIVLYPGKNNSLMGLLKIGLSTWGQTADPVEGMDVISMAAISSGDTSPIVAYDDTVFIAATRADVLRQAVQRYKGKTSQPSLASSNKSFTNISKQARQQNALTLWLNVDEAYAKLTSMFPADELPDELREANGLVDFQNVDNFIASFSLRETGIALDANMSFKDGSKSMFYNLIRTPNLSKEALKAIPAEAVALISLTLGGANSAQAQVAGAKIEEACGLDIASQIFGNVEQITLFAAPTKDAIAAQDSPIPPVAQAFGLAVTSKNPQQVHQLLSTLLKTAELLPADAQEALSIPESGRFDVTLANNIKFFGHTNPANKTMVLSLNSQVVDSSITAVRQNSSLVSGGKLQDALATLPPATSKLVLINVAGAIQLASQAMEFSSDETEAEVRKSLDELIAAAAKTTVRLQTTEQDNNFSLRLSVSDMPPIKQLVGPIVKLSQLMGETHKSPWEYSAPAPVSIAPASQPCEIDGKVDDAWADVKSNAIGNVAYTPVSGEADASASFKMMYDKQALYLLVDVKDDERINDSVEFWLDDGVEVFVDADNSKSDTYGDNDYQFNFAWDGSAPSMGETKRNKTDGVRYAFDRTDAGYRLEIKLPWATLGTTPKAGTQIGLDVHVNDDDDGGDRDTKLMWNTKNDIAWQNPGALGTGELAGLIAWWKFDEKDGRTAADSSGNGRDATVQGDPSWQPAGGKVGGAIALGGDGDFLDVDDESAFDFTGGVTVAAWVKVNAFDKPWQALVTKGDGTWRLQRNNETNTLEFACTGLQIANGNQYGSLFGTREIGRNEWHHVAGVYDGKRMSLYVDGALDASQEAWGTINVNNAPVQIGANTEMQDRFWNGLIDELRIYNYGLPEAQIKELATGK
jgi:tetratricopeptide (TPR) repeat protein